MYSYLKDSVGANIAANDIKCYKILQTVLGKDNQKLYLTPYQFMTITPEMLSGRKLVKALGDERIIETTYSGTDVNSISKGFIHTYGKMSEDDLINNLNIHCELIGSIDTFYCFFDFNYSELHHTIMSVALCECVIPKGTPYYIGFDDNEITKVESYASKAIRIEKILYEFTEDDKCDRPKIVRELYKDKII